MLNAPMPDDQSVLNSIGISLFILGCICIGIACTYIKHGAQHYLHVVRDWILYSLIFIIGVGITCTPWLIKNVNEVIDAKIKNPSLSNYLAGAVEKSMYDYTKIYSEAEIKERDTRASKLMTGDGKSENEDM